jgi:eukaryotic-like serine/threonine-protein kinase
MDGPPIRFPATTVLQLDRQGKEVSLPLPPGRYQDPRLSPDGKHIALTQWAGLRGSIVVYDRQRRNLSTLTPEPGSFFCPTWSPDGRRMAFTRFGATLPQLCAKNTDGGGEIEPLTEPTSDAQFPNSWSPDGKVLAYTVSYTADRSPTRKLMSSDVWLLSPEERGSAHFWFETPFRESAAAFSPDGKWVAYVSDESGSPEIYVRPHPGPGAKIKISDEAGIEPAWARGGRELLYRAGQRAEKFMVVEIQTSAGLTVSTPRPLFTSSLDIGGREDDFREYDVSSDGNDIIALRTVRAEETSRQLSVVTNWTAMLSRAGSPK